MSAQAQAFPATQPEPDAAADTLVLTRRFAAPRDLVFRLWTTPEHVVRWFGCHDTVDKQFEADVRPGGSYRMTSRREDGGVMEVFGTYREVVAPERLVFTWAWKGVDHLPSYETLVTLDFAEADGGTELTLRHETFCSTEMRDQHGMGWGMCFDRMAAILAAD